MWLSEGRCSCVVSLSVTWSFSPYVCETEKEGERKLNEVSVFFIINIFFLRGKREWGRKGESKLLPQLLAIFFSISWYLLKRKKQEWLAASGKKIIYFAVHTTRMLWEWCLMPLIGCKQLWEESVFFFNWREVFVFMYIAHSFLVSLWYYCHHVEGTVISYLVTCFCLGGVGWGSLWVGYLLGQGLGSYFCMCPFSFFHSADWQVLVARTYTIPYRIFPHTFLSTCLCLC